MHERAALRLRRQRGDQAHQVAGKTGPQPGRDPARAPKRGRLDEQALVVEGDLHAQPPQDGGAHLHVVGARAGDLDAAAGDGADHRPAARVDVVAPQRVRRAAPAGRALDPDGRGPFPADADAHGLQEAAQLRHVRLGGRVPDLAGTGGARGRQQRGLRAGDRRLVEVHRHAREPVRRVERVARLAGRARAHRAQGRQVRVDRAAHREVPARRGQPDTAAPRQ